MGEKGKKMSTLEKNEALLRSVAGERFMEAYEKVKNEEKRNCSVETCDNNQKIICYLRNGRKWRLNSIYDPDHAAELYAERYGKIRDFAPVCIFGLSDGKAVRRILENCNETQPVFIYEPDQEIFVTAMEHFPLNDIFERKQITLVVGGINDDEMQRKLSDLVTSQNRTLMTHFILPNYDILFTEKCKSHIDLMLYYSKGEAFRKNTEIEIATRFGDNILHNLPYILRESSVYQIKRSFAKEEFGDAPAIIVSAGPSLDKNIRDLKRAEGKAFIIGVDSALKALVREGIHFQMAISVDPRKNPGLFSDERVNRVPYILASYSLPLIAEKNEKRTFFMGGYGFGAFERQMLWKTGKELEALKTGGSVATEALSLAFNLGFKNIILVGQDLAFTDGKGHVSGFEKSEAADQAHVKSRVLTEVEAMGGGTVMTDIQMDSYRQWFEMEIDKKKNEVQVYNATEGGARIHGTTELTLRHAIETLCNREIDFDAIVASVPNSFSQEEREILINEYLTIGSQLEELEEKMMEGISSYTRLIELEEKNMQQTVEYKELIKKISEINHIEDAAPYMEFIKLYAKNQEYEAADDIYVAEELSVAEIAERGKRLLEGYLEGISQCKERVEQILMPELKKMTKCKLKHLG